MTSNNHQDENNNSKKFKINVSSLYPAFNDHISIECNSRIVFSGKFGIGKSYFLNDFFSSDINKDNFEVFHLYPVRYQVSSNTDIIDLLKYDIIISLLNKNEKIFDFDKTEDVVMLEYLFTQVVCNLPQITTMIGSMAINDTKTQTLILGANVLGKAISSFKKFKDKIKELKGKTDISTIQNILDKYDMESDIASQIINHKIEKLKGEKKSVLILDDLDRIDPDHVFRILNIFSTQLGDDNKELPNKFGFDKIILVGDIDNFKSIFYHKYGLDTDFYGYFNKYFSTEVFLFQNEEIITAATERILSEFEIEDDSRGTKDIMKPRMVLHIFLKDVLTKAFCISGPEKLNLRQLLKGINYPLKGFKGDNCSKPGYLINPNSNYLAYINCGVLALISIYDGDKRRLIKALKTIRNTSSKKNKMSTSAYNSMSKAMLLKASIKEKIKNKHGYTIESKSGEIEVLDKDGKNIKSSVLFYDLLTIYVENDCIQDNIDNLDDI